MAFFRAAGEGFAAPRSRTVLVRSLRGLAGLHGFPAPRGSRRGGVPQQAARGALGGWTIIALAAFCLGAAMTASERSSGTLRRALLLHPNRRSYAVGKVGAAAVLCLIAALVVGVANWVLGSLLLSGRGIDRTSALFEEVLVTGAGAVAVAAFSAIGAALGLLARSAYVLIAFGLVMLLVGESVVQNRLPSVADVMPGHLLERISRGGTGLWEMSAVSGPAAVFLLLAWAAASAGLSLLVFARSDV